MQSAALQRGFEPWQQFVDKEELLQTNVRWSSQLQIRSETVTWNCHALESSQHGIGINLLPVLNK